MIDLYEQLKSQPSDINEHLFILKEYATMVDHITEFGVRTGRSTAALLAGQPKYMISYDLNYKRFNYKLYRQKALPTIFDFVIDDVLQIEIEETDLLFIDTYHAYKQLNQELILHENKVKQFIILHDTVTFKNQGEDKLIPGLLQAVSEFVEAAPFIYRSIHYNNNGLMVLERERKK